MIYAVVLLPSNRIRGYYTEKFQAEEHARFINEAEKEVTYREKHTAKVITILQKRDKKEAAHD